MNNLETAKSHYLAITIGPIYQTIQRARKTRELWAASFILSELMREILLGLEKGNYGTALSPDVSGLPKEPETKEKREKHHGAGIWNDNCFYAITPGKEDLVKKELPDLLLNAKANVIAKIRLDFEKVEKKVPLSDKQIAGLFEQHFYCTAVLHSRVPNQAGQKKVLIELRDLLDSAECLYAGPVQYDDYVANLLFRPETVLPLYKLGFDDHDDKVFTKVEEVYRRLPSLLEIATREFKGTDAYKEVVEAICKQYKESRKEEPTGPKAAEEIEIALEESSATPEEDNQILEILKGKGVSPAFKKRHKYVAIVQSDGDGIGKIIEGFKDDNVDQMKEFSAQLMDFSKKAVDKIADYDGLPIYAGGDDLLFIAPLQNQHGKHLFHLLDKIKEHFEGKPLLQEASLSFGISIFYYKHPMGEALEEGRKQLFRIAKKLRFSARGQGDHKAKKAIAFRVLLHGGQAFGAVFQQGGPVWDAWKILLDERNIADTAFLSGMVHRLELLEFLLEDACDNKSADYFFKKHFNEARDKQKAFVNLVQKLAEAIYREYGTLHLEAEDQKDFFEGQFAFTMEEKLHRPDAPALRRRYCNNLLYSALRLIQFLNAEDHE